MSTSYQLDDEAIMDYHAWLVDRELSENTISSYMYAIRQYASEYSVISKANAIDWKAKLLGSGMKPKTVNLRLAAYNAYCQMIGQPREIVKTLKIHQASAVSNVISNEDYQKLCAALKAENPRWYYNIRLLASTGARASEFIRLKKADLDRGYAEIWTKGKMRRVYIPNSFKEESAAYYEAFAPDEVLVQSRFGKPITTRGVAENLKNFARKYGIPKEVMHPHSFRHLFALNFLNQTSNLSLLADVLGHSSVSTTAIYTRMTKEQQIEAINKTINW